MMGKPVIQGTRITVELILRKLRFPNRVRHSKPTSVVEAVAKLGARLSHSFTVVEPGRVRIASRPPG
jgi:hypothetical protein